MRNDAINQIGRSPEFAKASPAAPAVPVHATLTLMRPSSGEATMPEAIDTNFPIQAIRKRRSLPCLFLCSKFFGISASHSARQDLHGRPLRLANKKLRSPGSLQRDVTPQNGHIHHRIPRQTQAQSPYD